MDLISIRRLVALDMALHGRRFVLIEFWAGFLLPALLAVLSFAKGQWHSPLPWYILCVSLNYLPLFIHAALSRRSDGQKRNGTEGMDKAEVRRYTRHQFWLLVPLVVLIAAIRQEVRRKRG